MNGEPGRGVNWQKCACLHGDEEASPGAGWGVDGDVHGRHAVHGFGIGGHLLLQGVRQPPVDGAVLPPRHPVGSHYHLRQHPKLPQGSHDLNPRINQTKKSKKMF
jgi:hypothetical protein